VLTEQPHPSPLQSAESGRIKLQHSLQCQLVSTSLLLTAANPMGGREGSCVSRVFILPEAEI